jgi:hypothetical protein
MISIMVPTDIITLQLASPIGQQTTHGTLSSTGLIRFQIPSQQCDDTHEQAMADFKARSMMAGSVGRLSLVRPQFTGPPAASRRARIRGRLTVARSN